MLTHNLPLHLRIGALALLLTLAGGFAAPFTPTVRAAGAPPPAPASSSSVPASAASIVGVVDLSPTPPNDTQAVAPNIVMTFDDSGSMNWTRMSDNPPYTTDNSGDQISGLPDWSDGPWRCANVIDPDHPKSSDVAMRSLPMNGVYYNPNITYNPPAYADGTTFKDADSTLKAVWVDGMAVNRPLNPVSVDSAGYHNNPDLDYPNAGSVTNLMGTKTSSNDHRWKCGYGGSNQGQEDGWNKSSPMNNSAHSLSDGSTVTYPNGGPYYYRLKTGVSVPLKNGAPTTAGLQALYTASNWEAVPVPTTQYQNFANWYAYYRTRNQMARTSISRVFGTGTLATTISDPGATTDGGFGTTIRMAWQNLNSGTYDLPSDAIISSLIDTKDCTDDTASPSTTQDKGATQTPPDCYRSAFFNWIFQIPASGGTPTRSAANRAGKFFMRGNGNTGGTGNLEDPYWQPPRAGTGDGKELVCRQNFHMLVTDGLWNGDSDGPSRSNITLPTSVPNGKLPDGAAYPSTSGSSVTAIYAPVPDGGDSGYASLSDIAFNYWATNLRPDLYPKNGIVSPYLPDQTTSVFNLGATALSGSNVKATNINQEIYFNPANDPATWPHMSEYLVGLGVSGQLHFSTDTDCSSGSSDASDACLLRTGGQNSTGSVGWPTPDGSGSGIAANIDDTWHAALAGRGQFFSAGSPQQLIDQLSNILSNIVARSANASTSAVNASVLTTGALSFSTGYDSSDWHGVLQALILNADGTPGGQIWDAATTLNNATTPPAKRQILTASKDSSGNVTGMAFEPDSAFDASETSTSPGGLMYPASASSTNDTLATRVNYLRGDRSEETNGTMRVRNKDTLLGAIIDSQAVYVSYPSSGYTDNWPAGSPEAIAATASNGTDDKSYDSFVADHADRPGTLYVGANDGMLHAFNAPVPTCTAQAANGDCTAYDPGTDPGKENWAYVPRAVYGNLGNLTSKRNFKFAPTVNGTPVVRDVFFDSDSTWHTILVGGLRLGGRGVYALDITNPKAVTESSASTSVLWEFDADATAPSSCVSNIGSCNADDLGYTYGQPNIARLAYNDGTTNGRWVVLVPTGYYPDCTQTDRPANCTTLPAAANKYSALFVLDAETGAMIAELKTPTDIPGVTSYGITSPVLGDYNNDQVDDVAFAGDLAGNLWRFDLRGSTPSQWSVTLAYKGISDSSGKQGVQPITVMPRLFPDPTTNRFMVVFGTGKYLGASDNTSDSEPTQAIYGIRDKSSSSTVVQADLQQRYLFETTITDSKDPNYGVTLRGLCANSDASATKCTSVDALDSSYGGWRIDLSVPTASGERTVVTPAAIFDSNTAIISTLIPGSTDPCNPTVEGAVMLLDATNGGAGGGVSSIGGSPYIGARVDNVRTSGTIPVTTTVGGGKALLPGLTLTGSQKNPDAPFAGDAPVWRRRSWSVINNVH